MAYTWKDENGTEFIGSLKEFNEAMQKMKAEQIKREQQAARRNRYINGRDIVYSKATDRKDEEELLKQLRARVCGIIYNHCDVQCSFLQRLIKTQGTVYKDDEYQKMLIDIARQQCCVIRIVVSQFGLSSITQQLGTYYDAHFNELQSHSKEWRNYQLHCMQSVPARLRRSLPKYVKWGEMKSRNEFKPVSIAWDPELFLDWFKLKEYGDFDISFVRFD